MSSTVSTMLSAASGGGAELKYVVSGVAGKTYRGKGWVVIVVTVPIPSIASVVDGYITGTQIDGISLGDLAASYGTFSTSTKMSSSYSSTVVSSPFISSVKVGTTNNSARQTVLLYSYEPLTVS